MAYDIEGKQLLAEYFNSVWISTHTTRWMETGNDLTAGDFDLPYPIYLALWKAYGDLATKWKHKQILR